MLRKVRSSSRFLVAVVAFSLFTELFAYGVIVPVMPTALLERANVRPEDAQYWISILLVCESVTTLVVSPIAGYMTDICVRRKMPFLLSLALIVAAILMVAFSNSLALFVAGRCVQGAATAIVTVSGIAMVLDAIPEEKVAVTLGWLSFANTAGFTLGPALGGVLYRFGGWWAVFGTLLGMLALDFMLRCAVLENRRIPERCEFERDGSDDQGKPGTQVTVAERRDGDLEHQGGSSFHGGRKAFAMLTLLRQPRMLFMLLGVVTLGALLSSFDATLPIFVRDLFGWSSLGQGLIFIPTALPAVLDPFFGWCIDRLGVRAAAIGSFVLLVPTLICLRLVDDDNIAHKAALVCLLAMFGICVVVVDVAFFVETDDVVRHVQKSQPGAFGPKGAIAQSFGLRTMAFFLGILIGPLWGGMIAQYCGWKLMTATLGGLAGGTAVAMLGVGRPWRVKAGENVD